MKKNTYTKKQHDAIHNVKMDIDELDNKPRRLYSAMREFAEAFIVDDDRHLADVINSIDHAEDMYYQRYCNDYATTQILGGIKRAESNLTGAVARYEFDQCHKKTNKETLDLMWYAREYGIDEMKKACMRIVFKEMYDELDRHCEHCND